MAEFFSEYGTLILTATGETLYMVTLSVILSYLLGIPLGVLVTVTAPDSISPCKPIYSLLDWIINIIRSIPFIILIVALIPFTRWVLGSFIGPNGAIVALVIGAVPFVARLVQGSLNELDKGVIESTRAMGATNFQIITRVLLPEALPSLIRGMAVATITIVGYTAMAGAVGAGGLGDVAIRYGFHRYQTNVMFATIVVLVVLVQVIQLTFDALVKKMDKNK
ncbi:MAG: methionine ABC transporter permease [Angelakisella sp.]|nr:methionine ABC transporter permease [Angelakisella sp.]